MRNLEKYYVYFYILSFFILIAMIVLYKIERKLKKWIIIIAIFILCFQLFIQYTLYSTVEHMSIQDNITKYIQTVDRIQNLQNNELNNNLTNGVYQNARNINSKPEHNKTTSVLDAVNRATGKNYTSINALPDDPDYLNTFSTDQISSIFTGIQQKYTDTLKRIAELTTPIPDQKIPGYYAKKT